MIMHSEGGYMSFPAAGRRPVSLILSGPAAGAIGAAKLGVAMGVENVITADMGGTSYDRPSCTAARCRSAGAPWSTTSRPG